MPDYQITTLYQSVTPKARVGGWTENFFFTGANLQAALAQAARYALFRCPLLPSTSLCIGARCHDLSNVALSIADSFNRPGEATVLTDAPQMALQIKLLSANGASRRFKMPNLPDARVVSGEYNAVDAFTIPLDLFFTTLRTFFLRTRDRTIPIVDLVSVTAEGLVTVASDMALTAGTFLEFYRTRDTLRRKVKGPYPVLDTPTPTARTFKLGNWPGGIVTKGRIRRIGYVLSQITSAAVDRSVIRKIGRPIIGYVGRNSTAR